MEARLFAVLAQLEALAVQAVSAVPVALVQQASHQNKLYIAASLASLFVVAAYRAFVWSHKPKRGYGSGENNHWNRQIRTERPSFPKRKQFKLTDVWKFVDAGTTVDLDFVRDRPFSTNSGVDPNTKYPLSGHLIGRATWQKVEKPTAAQKAAQDRLTFDPVTNPNAGDKLLRAQLLAQNGGNPADAEPPAPRGAAAAEGISPEDALDQGWGFFSKLQTESGQWVGDYGGCLFLLPGMVIACFVSGFDLGNRKPAMLTYISNHQQADGGWGLHLEGPSTLFSTVLNYIAMRILGVKADDARAVAGRKFMHAHGGAIYCPQWGKYWMAVMGCYDWEGVCPIPAELWILPRWFPFHPGKMWCHSRLPYLGMSYMYSTRRSVPAGTPLSLELRKELFCPDTPFETVDWDGTRNLCATIDLYAPHTAVLDAAMWVFRKWEQYAPRFIFNYIRGKGVEFVSRYVDAEDLHTNYIDIGPVNKVNNMMTVFFTHGRDSWQFQKHAARLDDYLWVAEDGMKMNGYNGSQLWDTAFATQALYTAGPALCKKYEGVLTRIAAYVDASQIREDVPMREEFFRTISKGGWPFSTNDHGWPIADCTAEGLKAALLVRSLAQAGVIDIGQGYSDGMGRHRGGHIHPDRLADAVNVILAFHNPDGGWATYEEMRGGDWYEYLNPAEVWGDLMIDYTYTELTSACVQALAAFSRTFPHVRTKEVQRALAAGVEYVRAQQREDGSWYGSWAVCFTYGCWFGVEALTAGGEPQGKDREALKKVCKFLLSKQRADGGWGESYLSCLVKEYSDFDSTVINTAWALLALIHAQCPDHEAVARGIQFLIAKQTPAGDWAQEWCSGIFNRTCAITYTAYRNVFPLWALAAYTKQYKFRAAAGRGAGAAGAKRRGSLASGAASMPVEVEEAPKARAKASASATSTGSRRRRASVASVRGQK